MAVFSLCPVANKHTINTRNDQPTTPSIKAQHDSLEGLFICLRLIFGGVICFAGALAGASSGVSVLEKKQRAEEKQGKTEYLDSCYCRVLKLFRLKGCVSAYYYSSAV